MHDAPRGLHYDFFLESGDALKTWALPRPPSPSEAIECDALADHRLVYLDYEGPISGDRGTVARWDTGTFTVETWTDELVVISLAGQKLIGRVELRCLSDQPDRWRFVFAAS
jgi:hypothetical protein